MAERLREALVALAVAAAARGWLGAPSPALACTASRCMDPFRIWLGPSPVAVYRLDRSASWWVPAPRRQPGADVGGGLDDGCILRGTFTFRRLDTIRGWAPDTITARVPTGRDDCPGWDMWGSWGAGGMVSPTGTWIVALDGDAFEEAHFVAFYHLDSRGQIDNDGAFPGDYPETIPTTIAAWRAALGLPATDAAPPAPLGGDGKAPAGPLLGAAALGLAAGLWRSRPARRHP